MQHVLHVGLAKSASTFLQCNYFNYIKGYEYETSCRQCGSLASVFNWLFKINKSYDNLSYRKKYLRNDYPSKSNLNINKAVRESATYIANLSRPILLSSEGLCGVSYSPCRNNYEINLLIKEIFDDCKIILIVRKQDDWCDSIYRQLVFNENRFGLYIKFSDLYATKPSLKSLSYSGELNWHELYRNYTDIFGKENVLCLPYEQLVDNSKKFVEILNSFIGDEPELPEEFWNKRNNVSPFESIYKSSSILKMNTKKIAYKGLNEVQKNNILVSCKENNMMLSNGIGIDLSKYGYY
jgi:hypothetical protein